MLAKLVERGTGHADQDNQHYLSAAERVIATFAEGQRLDQPKNAPADQEERPVEPQNLKNRSLGMGVAPQKQAADEQQHEGPGQGSASHLVSPEGLAVCGVSVRGAALDPKPPF